MTRTNSAPEPHSILFDWGTTNLRAYLIDDSGRIIDCHAAKLGVKHVSRDEYPSIIRQVAGEWVKRYAVATIVLAGMVGGNLGWRDVPMVQSPAGADEIAAGMFEVDLTEMPPVKIIPGVFCKSAHGLPGMMRGEEVQILGALAIAQLSSGHLCLPGTHTKWVEVEQGKILNIVTSMTGEMFDLITAYSVLADALKGWDGDIDASAFRSGLEIARSGLGALQCIFITRVQQVIGEEQDTGRRASRLSGILIGAEALSMLTSGSIGVSEPLFIVGETSLAGLYAEAVRFFGRTAATIDSTKSFIGGALLLQAASHAASPISRDCGGAPREPAVRDQTI
jgi:2-dehydro-3-deoxygalactonokinase